MLPGILLMLAVLLVAADPVSAAEQTASGGGYLAGYENTDPQPTAISWWSTAAYLVSLFAIFAFVVGMAYLPLGPNRSICVVLMAGKCFMLGVTEHNITLLTELDDPEVIAHLKRESEEHPLSGDMFAKQFGALGDLVQKIPPRFRK